MKLIKLTVGQLMDLLYHFYDTSQVDFYYIFINC